MLEYPDFQEWNHHAAAARAVKRVRFVIVYLYGQKREDPYLSGQWTYRCSVYKQIIWAKGRPSLLASRGLRFGYFVKLVFQDWLLLQKRLVQKAITTIKSANCDKKSTGLLPKVLCAEFCKFCTIRHLQTSFWNWRLGEDMTQMTFSLNSSSIVYLTFLVAC